MLRSLHNAPPPRDGPAIGAGAQREQRHGEPDPFAERVTRAVFALPERVAMSPRPRIVGIGGTSRANSSSELALRACLARAAALGADTEIFSGADLELPMYGGAALRADAQRLVESLRRCDGVVVSSPSYHGALSGALKNALDYVEELRQDARPYLDGRAVGTIVCAYGPQAIGTTLVGLRSIVHALRGWPTPSAAGINSSGRVFDDDGRCVDRAAREQIELVARQVVEFATMKRLSARPCAQPTVA